MGAITCEVHKQELQQTISEKLCQRIKNNPKNVRFEELDKILIHYGFTRRQPSGGSSHYYYTKGDKVISVPFHQPHIKGFYVERAMELLEGEISDGNKNLEYYLELPYKYTIYPAEEGGYVIEIPDLPGCISQGETAEDALVMIEDAKRGWLEVSLDQGIEIPEPSRLSSDFSGKFNIWVPKSLHKVLADKAKEENISLNQFILYQLSRGVGYKG